MTDSNSSSTSHLRPLPPSAQALLNVKVRHPRIAQLMTDLSTLVYPGSQDSLLLVCGPTGVGKSTLAHYVVEKSLQMNDKQMSANAGLIPAVYVEAPSSGENEFSWRLFYSRILSQLDLDIASQLPRANFGIDTATGRMVRPRSSSGQSLASLRTAVERALEARGTKLLVIDEAAHIIRQSSPRRLEIQLDTLKSLSNACGAQILLIGAYDLYQLMSLSGQLSRRTHVLHFERYRQDRDEDKWAFATCVQQFQDTLPHLWSNKLFPHAAALQDNTVGCIGTLSAVLMRTARLLEENHKEGQVVDALRRSLLTDAQHKSILSETLDGELAINPGLLRTLPKAARESVTKGRKVA